jgi:solute carrier family 8 (sodium/calcium exchanger)
VANLTLMALGSSAPEILLSVIEIASSGFYAGELGPSTIVGSAAFNLMVISAVCVTAIPDGQGRYIRDLPVFYMTATFSVAAYVWLIVILNLSSPNIVTPAEGFATFLAFPLLVWWAYLADQKASSCCREATGEVGGRVVAVSRDGRDVNVDDALVAYDPNLSESDQMHVLAQMLDRPKTRAYYRVNAVRAGTGGKAAGKASGVQLAIFNFRSPVLSITPHQKWVDVHIERAGNTAVPASVAYRSVGMSSSGETRSEGLVEFAAGQVTSFVRMSVLDAEAAFYVVLVDPSAGAECGKRWNCAVLVEQPNSPGMLKFEHEQMSIKESQGVLWVTIKRVGGASGKVTFRLKTKDVTAFGGHDYVAIDQEVFMASGQLEHRFPVHVFDDDAYENDETFQLLLSEPTGGLTFDPTTDGGAERAVATVTIISDEAVRRKVDELAALVNLNSHDLSLSADSWGQQFKDAVVFDGEPSPLNIFMYLLALPWKAAFAFTPPPRICGGWLCFAIALIFIGLLTALIGDLAAHMGCCMGMKSSITAITFVALGTSLPDTFASRTAAVNEPYADSSIGNITGSNSVNVFLGLGLPWMIASVYWTFLYSAADEEAWRARYETAAWYTPSMPVGFVVEGGDLGFSVGVFTVCALVTLGTLLLRRAALGFELGGNATLATSTSAFFVLLWFLYIFASVAHTYGLV